MSPAGIQRRWAYLLILSLLLCGCNAGSGSSTALQLGTVDVMRVLEERPETVNIRLDWASQASDAYIALSGVKSEEEYLAVQAQLAENSESWQRRIDEFMEESIAIVEVEAEKIAKERGLDMVLVDNPFTRNLAYHDGEDITLDVLLRNADR